MRFFLQSVPDTSTGCGVLRRPAARLLSVIHCSAVNEQVPAEGQVPSQGLLLSLPLSLPPFTIVSGSGAFSAMTCDLLTPQSFLLNLLIRFSLSSLGGRSSTLAPDDALRSNSGSRTDLSARKDKSHKTLVPE